jgi:hypothetical protein
MEVSVAERQGGDREVEAERSRRQNLDRRKTNWQRGRTWATSVLANAKSELHPDTSSRARRREVRVESLTRGDLLGESAGEVSRGRSSEEAFRKRRGAKGQRNQGKALQSIVSQGKESLDVSRPQPDRLALREPRKPRRRNRGKLCWGMELLWARMN